MNSEILKLVEGDQYKKRPDVRVGDTVKLHMNIRDGDKARVQIFEGIVIALKGTGTSQTITVRKISMGVGVERIIPVQSPLLEKIEVLKRGDKVRKSKLYYMRDRIGKRAMKVRGGTTEIYLTDEDAKSEVEEEVKSKTEAAPEAKVEAKTEAK